MFRKKLTFGITLVLTLTASLGFAQQARRPNILWLVAEDLSPLIAAYGDHTAPTPNLDRLFREGVKYQKVFSVSGVCAPSRSALITGMYPTSIGTNNMRTLKSLPKAGLPPYSVVLPPHVKMFSELLRREGYYTTNNAKHDYQFEPPRSGWDESSNTAHWKNRPAGKPFFSVFNIEITHESQIWAQKDLVVKIDPAKVPVPPYYPESPVIRNDLARMYTLIMEMDRQVGERVKELEDAGLLEETIIFWYGDNGGPIPRHKREVYDTGLHVPLVIRYPGKQQAGQVDTNLVSFVDFAPTVLSLAGAPVPDYMHGQVFAGPGKAGPRKYIYAARDRMDSEFDMVRAVRDHRFKYIRNYQPEKPYMQDILYRKQMALMQELYRFEEEGKLQGVQKLWFRKTKDREELFDTAKDPYELNNLAQDPAYKEKLKELRMELDNWMKFTEDKGFIREIDWVASIWPGLKQPKTGEPQISALGNKLEISCSTPGASISYKILNQGQDAKKLTWALYTSPLSLKKGQTLLAVADRIGFEGSDTITFTHQNNDQ